MKVDNYGHGWPSGIIHYGHGIKHWCPCCHKQTLEGGPEGYRCTNCKWPENVSLFGMKVAIEPNIVDDMNAMVDANGEEPDLSLMKSEDWFRSMYKDMKIRERHPSFEDVFTIKLIIPRGKGTSSDIRRGM